LLESKEDIEKMMGQNWDWGPLGLVLQKWSVDFDSSRELTIVQKVWVMSPSLPLVFLREEVLASIDSKIGQFVGLELNWEAKVDRTWASLQVELDLCDYLLDDIELVMGDRS
jgi:hypothetical protein